MIHGTVVRLQARMSVLVRLEDKSHVEIEFVIDTGFEGFLTQILPTTPRLQQMLMQ